MTTGFPCTEEGEEESSDDSGRPPSDNPYCDVVRQTGEPYDSCFDRKDYSESTGLYPCRDGSDVEDWRECEGGGLADGDEERESANDENDENDDGRPDNWDDPKELEEGESVGVGEPTVGYEEDDGEIEEEEDEAECRENIDGALGDPIPCE